ncbi:mitochondrial enolase superfamily member 1 [Grus japonensis]|uniref:Mitochondrial enolase superfamily member 1 n=1 Tax=Grus japonensis TaxID=30415 RepID=A0ABC9WFI7_GRUJA
MGPDWKQPPMRRELANVIARPLSIIFDQSCRLGEVPQDWRKENVTPIFKKDKKEEPGNYRLVSLTLIPGKVMEQLIMETISRHMKDKKLLRSSQHGFTKGKSCLTNLITFYNELMHLVDEGRAKTSVHWAFSKASNAVSHKNIIAP